MPSVNLAPGTQHVVAAQRRRRRLFLLTFLILVVVGIAWGGLLFYRSRLTAELEAEQEKLRTINTEIARLSDNADRVQLFERRLGAISTLLDNHITWEPVFQTIEGLLPASVTLTSLDVNASQGELSIGGVTTDTDQVAQALASLLADQSQTIFSNGKFSKVARVGQTVGEGATAQEIVQYQFQITLTFNPGILTN